jgi:hypothetical protein
MTEVELKHHLAEILTEEDRNTPDWDRIVALCLDLSRQLSVDGCDTCPHHIHHFIADCDVRKRDYEYAEAQRANVRTYLERAIL